ncbi:MAG: peroxidase [Gemmatimonadetes bacterium]|nr:peroxidase [Gemmatimonadota bacterium]
MSAEAGDALVHAIVDNWGNAELPRAERALCAFAVKLTAGETPMSAGDLDRLRAEGLDDRAIHDAVQVIGFFNYITRVADGLGVEAEEFIDRWGVDG